MKDTFIGLLAIAALVVAVFAYTKPAPFGAQSSGDFYTPAVFYEGSLARTHVATSSQGSPTITAAQFRGWVKAATVSYSPGLVLGGTLTLPASSTIPDLVPRAGDRQTFCVRNSTSTAAVAVTFAGGTGTNLLVASSSVSALGSTRILTGKVGCITLIRQAQTATTFDIDALLTVFN